MDFIQKNGEFMKSLNAIISIKDNISNQPIKEKSVVLNHLRNGKHIAAICGVAKDVFTDENIKGEWLVLSDGVYKWTSDIVYYFEKYNLKLPEEFLRFVLGE